MGMLLLMLLLMMLLLLLRLLRLRLRLLDWMAKLHSLLRTHFIPVDVSSVWHHALHACITPLTVLRIDCFLCTIPSRDSICRLIA
jgi:hypothetical protein